MGVISIKEILNLNRRLWAARTIIAAAELGICELVGKKGASLEEVASKGGFDRRGAKALLDALIPLGLLNRGDDDRYTLTKFGRKHFLPGKPGYVGLQMAHSARLWQSWSDLPESVKTGKPHWSRHGEKRAENAFVGLADALFPRNFALSRKAAKKLGVGKKIKGLRILDVAAGSAAWSLGFLAEDSTSRSTALDFEPVLEVAKKRAAEVGVSDRLDTIAGDLRKLDFGKDKYDIIILGHICHSEGAEHSEKLIAKSAKALAAGGKLIIADAVPDNDRRGPLHSLLFAINMLVNTLEGGVYTFREFKAWIKSAGLKKVAKLKLPGEAHSPLIVAVK